MQQITLKPLISSHFYCCRCVADCCRWVSYLQQFCCRFVADV